MSREVTIICASIVIICATIGLACAIIKGNYTEATWCAIAAAWVILYLGK